MTIHMTLAGTIFPRQKKDMKIIQKTQQNHEKKN